MFINMSYSYNKDTDVYHLKEKNKSNKKNDLINRMMNSYRKTKRKKKIEKLEDNPNHWEGLQ